MRLTSRFVLALLATFLPAVALAQRNKNEGDFVKEKPAVGETVPEVTAYDPSGNPLKTSALRGHYTVLTFGCLT